jgi:hypothetical protein
VVRAQWIPSNDPTDREVISKLLSGWAALTGSNSGSASSEERLLAEAIAGWAEWYPDVEVRPVLAAGDARVHLIDANTNTQLLIVGTRGRGGRGLTLPAGRG